MKKKLTRVTFGLGLMAALTLAPMAPLSAEEVDEIVVSATGIPTPLAQIGASVDIITAEDLERQQITYLQDALRTVAGVSSYQSGGPGSTSNVFLRGMTGKYSGVYVDGVQINDPASQQAAWAYLPTHGLESVEVLRGTQGVLYGSEAIGGAISMFTAVGGETQHGIDLQTGSFGTNDVALSSRGMVDNLSYGVAIKQADSDGISAANENNGNSEEDGYESLSARGRFVLNITDALSVDLALRSISSEIETDAGYGTPMDDGAYYTDFDALGGRLKLTYEGDDTRHEFAYGRSEDISSAYTASILTTRGARETSSYRGTKTYADNMQVMLGVEQETETYETSDDRYEADNLAAYAVMQFKAGPFSSSLAMRRDDHDSFGTHDTFRLSTLVDGGKTGTRLSYGTGFRAPSLYEMFGRSDYCVANICGNENLKPEESRGYDVAFILKPSDKVSFELARFDIKVNDFIVYGSEVPSNPTDPCLAESSSLEFTATSCGKYQQSNGDNRAQGYELRFEIDLSDQSTLSGNFTKLDAEKENGQRDIRRPEETLNMSFTHQFSDALAAGLSLMAVRDTVDTDFAVSPYVDVPLKDYDLVTLRAAYQLRDATKIYARIENALDEEYETVLGYGTPGRAFYVGVSASF